MHQAILLTGSNLNNRLKALTRASALIEERVGAIVESSAIYETAPWGFNHANSFLNQVLIIQTGLSPGELLKKLNEIEIVIGRVRDCKAGYHARIIDIDILFYDQQVINEEHLTVPHAKLHERRFALVPLTELAAEFIHPVLKKSMRQLNEECEDKQMVKPFSP